MKYKPANREELKALCNDESVYLGDIDTSLITDMSMLFYGSSRKDFSGIESWDVSKVENMSYMFCRAKFFNHPISSWNISKVKYMYGMFHHSVFNHPLNSWNVSGVENLSYMFFGSPFNHPLDSWDVGNVENMENMFKDCTYSHSLESWGEKNPFKK